MIISTPLRTKRVFYGLLLIASGLLTACSDDQSDDPVPSELSLKGKVLLLNEGGFQKGNAGLSAVDPNTFEVRHDLFSSVNGRPMGDVLHSVSLIDGQYWFVVNNSGKIWVVDTSSLKIIRGIEGFASPRHALKVADDKIYVSDLFGGSISILKSSESVVSGKVVLPGWTEQMVIQSGKVWVGNKSSSHLYAIDPTTDRLSDSIAVRKNGGTLIATGEADRLILFCEAEWDLSSKACIYQVDTKSGVVVDSLEFELGESVGKVFPDPMGKLLYYILDGKLHTTEISDLMRSAPALIDLGGMSIYGAGINPTNGDIYLSDAVDFTNRSEVHIYRPDGTLRTTFKAGVNCNGFRF
ncbi:MAG: hypothetical protein H6606_07860 [Flavobacteriales bacterium]|nr:hypothetical protein [Flavobacteriales bacterium]